MISKSEKETFDIATKLAKKLKGGEMILLYGDLGVGKTFFVSGLAKVIGIKENIKSPTFNILKCYKISKRKTQNAIYSLCHIDAYRLNSLNDLLDIGIEDYINDNSIIVVEWADNVKGIENTFYSSLRSAELAGLRPAESAGTRQSNTPMSLRGAKRRGNLMPHPVIARSEAMWHRAKKIIKIKMDYGKKDNERVIEIKSKINPS